MSSAREEFLRRVRAAVAEGNRPGESATIPSRGTLGYQGAGDDPLTRLAAELAAAGGQFHRAAGPAEAVAIVRGIVEARGARRVLVGDGAVLDGLDLRRELAGPGREVVRVGDLPEGGEREEFFAAEVGISGVEGVIAETGSLVLATRRDQPRSLSLLVPVHIAVARREQVVPDLFDLLTGTEPLPGCLSLITGPSKTGDIELRLVTGVHGPGEVHLVLLER